MYYRMNYHVASKTVKLESDDVSAPAAIAGHTSLGIFRHDNEAEVSTVIAGMQGLADNHTLYHHIQEALFKQLGIQDMQSIKTTLDVLRSISIGTGTVSVAAGADAAALTVTPTPANAADGRRVDQVIFTSSDPTKATVNALGVIHGVAAGSAVITATLKSNNVITATRNVTVTAP